MNAPIDTPKGLTSAEAAHRFETHGANVLPDTVERGWRRILLDSVREPMFLLLITAAALYLVLGDVREGAFLLLMVVAMVAMTLYQEGRTERALQTLRDLSAPTALVHRDGRLLRVPASTVVPGDLLELGEGVRVPADALVIAQSGLMADESMLTGESVPVSKIDAPATPAPPSPGGAGQPWIYAGTMVVQGTAVALVERTGAHSEMGRIGASLARVKRPPGRLQREIGKLAGWLAVFGGAVSIALVLLLASRGTDIMQALLAGLALSMSVLPEEFPVILTVFPALGAWRLAKVRVLTRRLAAIEILGATNVLCVDKTGTLTENRMRLQAIWRNGQAGPSSAQGVLSAPLRDVLMVALLASRPRSTDPLEAALWDAAGDGAQPNTGSTPAWNNVRDYPLTASRPMLARAWEHEGALTVALKGAPEAVLPLCTSGADDAAPALAIAAALAADGLRVLAVARAAVAGAAVPDDPTACRYELTGLIAVADPLRADIAEAVADCVGAGIRIVMITGDHPQTARAIARQAGLPDGATLTGHAIRELSGAALSAQLRGVSVCARIAPQQKLAIVQALQLGGDVVAMTGDGVNDAPALRAANVGVAMGLRGTDVAREAAELTLLDDRFASLVAAIAGGRRIFDNMRRSMTYVAAMHVPIAGLALLPPLLGWPVVLYPAHVVFLELMIDPACALAFENETGAPDLMRRPPRAIDEPLFGRKPLALALLQGMLSLVLLAPAYGLALHWLPESAARAAIFTALVLCNLALLAANLHGRGRGHQTPHNQVFRFIAAIALVLLAAVLTVPGLSELFQFSNPGLAPLLAALMLAVVVRRGVTVIRRWHG